MTDFLHEAIARMAADGLLVEHPLADGQLHRCPLADKPRSTSGAYIIHADDMPVAWWKNWVTDIEETYCSKSQNDMSRKERKAFEERMRAIKAAAQEERQARWADAAKMAQAEWEKAKPAKEHPYLERKSVEAFGLRVDGKGRLLVPVMDADGKLMSLQRILPDKPKDGPDKPFLAGGKASGGYFHIPAKDGAKDGTLLICEGYATGASLAVATGNAVLVAFSAGNLEAVAKMARAKFPARMIVICGDYDVPNERDASKYPDPGGIGAAKARAAAMASGGCLAICKPIDGMAADFNDYHVHNGLGAVQSIIENALVAGAVTSCPMPDGYMLVKQGKRAGLYKLEDKQDGTMGEVWLGPPLEVLAATRDATGNDWGLMLKWHDPDGHVHEWAMPQSLLYGQHAEWFALLAHGGWLGNPACRKLIAGFLSSVRPVQKIRCVPNTGWSDNLYVLPDAVYGTADDDDKPVLQSMMHDGLYQFAGTFEEWQKMAGLCVGNSRLGFALACSFAGPLLRLADIEGGAFSFEGGSSSGKTTGCQVAASVWGGAAHVRSWRATDNALESVAAVHNDNLLVLDEIGQVKARALDEAVYMLANGCGKSRSGRDGGLRKQYRWLAVVISSGEIGLADKLTEDGRKARAGQDVRFCGIPVDKSHISNLHGMEDAGALVRQVKILCAANYGHAGRKFLELLTVPKCLADVRANIHKGIDAFMETACPADADGQVKRVAMRFALAGIAGAMARDKEILPKDFDAAGYAKDCFASWLEQRGGAGALEDKAILAQVRAIIERDGQARFQDIGNPDTICINRLGFVRRNEDKPSEYIILPEQFRLEFAKGYSEKQVANVLRDAGWLEVGTEGRNKTRRSLPGLGQQRVYVLCLPGEK